MRTLLLLLVSALSPAWAGEAAPLVDGEPTVALSLVPARTAARPGTPLRVALLFDIEPGWHIYWSNPGETGLATTASLTVGGDAVDGPAYPVPRRHLDDGGIRSNVYEGSTALFWQVPAPAAGSLALRAEAAWLVCRERCVYQTGAAEASVPVRRRAKEAWPPAVAARFAETQPTVDAGFTVATATGEHGVETTVQAPAGSSLFLPVAVESWATRRIERVEGDEATFVLVGDAPAPPALPPAWLRLPDGVARVRIPTPVSGDAP